MVNGPNGIKINGHHPTMTIESFLARLLAEDQRAWANLKGLMHVLALPPLRRAGGGGERRVQVELELERGRWQPIDTVRLDRVAYWVEVSLCGGALAWGFEPSKLPQWRSEGAQAPSVTS